MADDSVFKENFRQKLNARIQQNIAADVHDSTNVIPDTSLQLTDQSSKQLTTPKPQNKKFNVDSYFPFTKTSWKFRRDKQVEDEPTSSVQKRLLHQWCIEIDACVKTGKQSEEEARNTQFEDFFIGVVCNQGKASEKAKGKEQEYSPPLAKDEYQGSKSAYDRYLYDTYCCCDGTEDTEESKTGQDRKTRIEEDLGMDDLGNDIFEVAKELLDNTTEGKGEEKCKPEPLQEQHESNKFKSYKAQSSICKKYVKTLSARIRGKNQNWK